MSFKISSVRPFVVDVVNRPGMLARVLEALRNAGANLEFVIARRVTQNTARLFVAPLKGAKQLRAAAEVGLRPAGTLHTLRIAGPDRAGAGSEITRAIADAGLNIRGLSAAAVGKQSVCYVAFALADDAARAAGIVRKALSRKR